MFNPDVIETVHDLDALIRAAKLKPTENIIQALIDAELDGNGRFVGFDAANRYWHEAISQAV